MKHFLFAVAFFLLPTADLCADTQTGIAFFAVPFETFTERICPDVQMRNQFVAYYDKLMHTLADMPHEKRMNELRQLRQKALETLELKHSVLAHEINQRLLADSSGTYPDEIQCLLTRYGAFEQFNKERIRSTHSVWKRVKEYTHEIASRAFAWVDSVRHKLHV